MSTYEIRKRQEAVSKPLITRQGCDLIDYTLLPGGSRGTSGEGFQALTSEIAFSCAAPPRLLPRPTLPNGSLYHTSESVYVASFFVSVRALCGQISIPVTGFAELLLNRRQQR